MTVTAPSLALPDGYVVRLADETWVQGGGVLVGGWPKRLARLTGPAAELLAGGAVTVTDARTRALAEHLVDSGLGVPVATALPAIGLGQLTVVVPTQDRPAELGRLLESIPGGVARVLVVDDGSRDPRAVARVARRGGADVLALPFNRGPAAARNAGLAATATDYVAFVDSDVEVEPGCLELLLRHFADPRLAVAAPRVLGRESAQASAVLRYENARSSLDLGDEAALVRPRGAVTWVSTTCVVARVVAVADGFDETMRSGEDVDLVWSLAGAGWRVRYEPDAVVRHDHRARLIPWMRRKFFYGTGARLLAQKHPEAIAPVVLPPWGVLVLIAALCQRRWSLPGLLVICGVVGVRVHRRIGPVPGRAALSARLVGNGLLAVLAQGVALLLRHWWPLTALAVPVSARVRRAMLVAAAVDTVWEYRRVRPRLDPIRFAVLRRLDDGAYGAGVWWSSLRGRACRALLPALTWRSGR